MDRINFEIKLCKILLLCTLLVFMLSHYFYNVWNPILIIITLFCLLSLHYYEHIRKEVK